MHQIRVVGGELLEIELPIDGRARLELAFPECQRQIPYASESQCWPHDQSQLGSMLASSILTRSLLLHLAAHADTHEVDLASAIRLRSIYLI